MDLKRVFPVDISADPASGLPELMRAILMRSQFDTVIRYTIGWRGLQQVLSDREGWTAKIRGWSGVFGLYFESWTQLSDWHFGNFGLCYFPDPEEELIERCSLHAAAFCQQPDYLSRVRNFLMDPEMPDIFGIGRLSLCVRQDSEVVCLSMACLSHQRTICPDGVYLNKNGSRFEIVAPGGFEQNFPAFETASAFFDVLAASLAVFLEDSPASFRERRFPGWAIILGQSGKPRKADASDIWHIGIELGYGQYHWNGNAPCLISPETSAPTIDICWQFPDPIPDEYATRPWWRGNVLQPLKIPVRSPREMDMRTPIILVSGFLGSGKTSFLKHFIEYQTQRSRYVAVIQNEIGEIGLDGKILDYTVTEIDGGCVCCSLSGSLSQSIRRICSEFQPDTIVIETTGLANPLNLLDDMIAVKDLVRFDCTLTVLDALNVEQTLLDYPLSVDQIRGADILMLNKVDLIGQERIPSIIDRIRSFNAIAPLFQTVDGNLNPALVLETEVRAFSIDAAEQTLGNQPAHLHHGLFSKTIRMHGPLDREKFLHAIEQFPPVLFRAKGIVEFMDSEQPFLFQYVAGRYDLSILPHPAHEGRFITLIATGTDLEQTLLDIHALTSVEEMTSSPREVEK